MNLEKIFLKIIAVIFGIIIFFYGMVYLFFNSGNLNFIEKDAIKKTALKYIETTYPDYRVDNISINHHWKDNWYVVTYSNSQNDARTLVYITSEKLLFDNYIEHTSDRIIHNYTETLEKRLENNIKEKVSENVSVGMELYKNDEEKRSIVLKNEVLHNEPVECSLFFYQSKENSNSSFSKVDFANIIIKSVHIIRQGKIPVKTIEFIYQFTGGRYDLKWSDDMITKTPEQIAELVK